MRLGFYIWSTGPLLYIDKVFQDLLAVALVDKRQKGLNILGLVGYLIGLLLKAITNNLVN